MFEQEVHVTRIVKYETTYFVEYENEDDDIDELAMEKLNKIDPFYWSLMYEDYEVEHL